MEACVMPTSVPEVLAAWMQPFAVYFTTAVWRHVLVLVAGALLAPGWADRHGGAAHHGPGPSAGLRRLPPRPQPGALVLPRRRAPAVAAAGGGLRADWASRGRHRRHD